jgi:hypothetical protein
VKGYFLHCLPTLWENITAGVPPPGQTTWLPSASNFDNEANCLTTPIDITIPGIIGYSELDGTVGWNNLSPVTETPTAVSSPGGGPYTLTVPSTAGIVAGMAVTGAGIIGGPACVSAVNSGTGVVTIVPAASIAGTPAGSIGTLTLSSYVFECNPSSTTQAILAAAAAVTPTALPVTGYNATAGQLLVGVSYPDGHLFLPSDITEYQGFFTSKIDPSWPISF